MPDYSEVSCIMVNRAYSQESVVRIITKVYYMRLCSEFLALGVEGIMWRGNL